VLPTFFVIGIIFIPLGVGLYITSQQVINSTKNLYFQLYFENLKKTKKVSEVIVDYTNCNTAPLNWTSENLGDGVYSWKYENNTCYIQYFYSSFFPLTFFF